MGKGWPDLSRTRAALAAWDDGAPARDAALQAAETDEAVLAWLASEDAARLAVVRAYGTDTADRNSMATLESCMSVRDVRKMLAAAEADAAES